jgi:hypothetical protein
MGMMIFLRLEGEDTLGNGKSIGRRPGLARRRRDCLVGGRENRVPAGKRAKKYKEKPFFLRLAYVWNFRLPYEY